jgi:hypothetical protein
MTSLETPLVQNVLLCVRGGQNSKQMKTNFKSAYEAGFDAGVNGSNPFNTHFKIAWYYGAAHKFERPNCKL